MLNLFSFQEKLEESLFGEVGRGDPYNLCAQFEAQDVGITVFVFSKRCASGVRTKERGNVEKGGKKSIHIY